MFFKSQAKHEQQHIIDALSFELSKVNDPKIRERQVAILHQIDGDLGKKVGDNLNITPPKELDELTLKFARQNHPGYPITPKKAEVEQSEALSMVVKKGEGTIETRKVAFLLEKGSSKKSVDVLKKALEAEGAEAVLIAPHVGTFTFSEGDKEDIQHTYDTEASVCYDAVYTPSGSEKALAKNPDYFAFINEAFRHCKALAFAEGTEVLVDQSFIEKDKGVILEKETKDWTQAMIDVMKQHRVWDREESRKVPI